jgi:hypothetical protein
MVNISIHIPIYLPTYLPTTNLHIDNLFTSQQHIFIYLQPTITMLGALKTCFYNSVTLVSLKRIS